MVLVMMLVVVVMVHRRSRISLVDQVPPAHTQVLTVSVCRHARLAVAHEAGWRVAERVDLRIGCTVANAAAISGHVEGIRSATTGSAHLERCIAASADTAH